MGVSTFNGAALRIKGRKLSALRFFCLAVAVSIGWLALSSELGYFARLYGRASLLHLSIAYSLPSTPLLLLLTHFDVRLARGIGFARAVGFKCTLGLFGAAVVLASIPFVTHMYSALIGCVVLLGLFSGITFSTAYQLVPNFRNADAIMLGMGCVASGPIVLLIQMSLNMQLKPTETQWFLLFVICAGVVLSGWVAVETLILQYWTQLNHNFEEAMHAEDGVRSAQHSTHMRDGSSGALQPLLRQSLDAEQQQAMIASVSVQSLHSLVLASSNWYGGDADDDDDYEAQHGDMWHSTDPHVQLAYLDPIFVPQRQLLCIPGPAAAEGVPMLAMPPPMLGRFNHKVLAQLRRRRFGSQEFRRHQSMEGDRHYRTRPAHAPQPSRFLQACTTMHPHLDVIAESPVSSAGNLRESGTPKSIQSGLTPSIRTTEQLSTPFNDYSPLSPSKPQVSLSVFAVLKQIWAPFLAAVISSTVCNILFPFLTFVPAAARDSPELAQTLPRALFFIRIFCDLLGRVIPRVKQLMMTSPAWILLMALLQASNVPLFLVYIKSPVWMHRDWIPVLLVAVTWVLAGFVHTNAYLIAPNQVHISNRSTAAALMAFAFHMAHVLGLGIAVLLCLVMYGTIDPS